MTNSQTDKITKFKSKEENRFLLLRKEITNSLIKRVFQIHPPNNLFEIVALNSQNISSQF
jgi:hypothetical protein